MMPIWGKMYLKLKGYIAEYSFVIPEMEEELSHGNK